MTQGKRAELSAAQRTAVWCPWKAGQSLLCYDMQIARRYKGGKNEVSVRFLSLKACWREKEWGVSL